MHSMLPCMCSIFNNLQAGLRVMKESARAYHKFRILEFVVEAPPKQAPLFLTIALYPWVEVFSWGTTAIGIQHAHLGHARTKGFSTIAWYIDNKSRWHCPSPHNCDALQSYHKIRSYSDSGVDFCPKKNASFEEITALHPQLSHDCTLAGLVEQASSSLRQRYIFSPGTGNETTRNWVCALLA